LENTGDLAKVFGTEQAGSDDRERSRRSGVQVFEAVNDSARDEDGVAVPPLHRPAIDGVGQDALETIGGLIVGVVAMSRRDFGSGSDFQLKHGDGASGNLRVDEVAYDEASETDLFLGSSWHELFLFLLAFGGFYLVDFDWVKVRHDGGAVEGR